MVGTFKQFLTESRSQPISLDRVKQFAADNCTQFVQTGMGHVFRGIADANEDFLYAQPSGQRRSAFATKNWYNLILSNHPSWSDFPKRNESFICANSAGVANSYGQLYVAIIPDQTQIAVAPKLDIQISFDSHLDVLNLNSAIELLTQYATEQQDLQSPPVEQMRDSYEHLIDFLQSVRHNIDRYRQSHFDNMKDYNTFLNMLDKYKPQQLFEKVLGPDENGFTKVQAPQVDGVSHKAEMWFSSPAVFVKSNIFADIEPQLVKAV